MDQSVAANSGSVLDEDLFIFEMANNHQGSVEHGLRIVEAMSEIAKNHGIRGAVKLQYRNLDTFIHPRALQESDNKHIRRFMDTRLSDHDMRALVESTRDAGMTTVVTPFDEESVRKCVDHGVDVIKVASCSADDWPLLEAIADADRPIVVSTGGLNIPRMDDVFNFFAHRHAEFAMLHCVAIYPTPMELLNMDLIGRMRQRYRGIAIGYSGHEDPDDTDIVKIAVAKGAQILERHVGVPDGDIKLNGYSMNPEETSRWVAAALKARAICGTADEKVISKDEEEALLSLRRGVFARRPVARGQSFSRDRVYFAFPSTQGQLTSGSWTASIEADKAYAPDNAITAGRENTLVEITREFVHEFKGMFAEAGIDFGPEYEIELSHHLGLAEFRKTGALIVNLVNREYCKKLVAQLPGQQHPTHRHMKKEEVFQVLWGDLTVTINDVVQPIGPGDMVLVRRGDRHSFETQTGAIFEEVSTQHVVGDSIYDDPAIAPKDPIERKTFLEAW